MRNAASPERGPSERGAEGAPVEGADAPVLDGASADVILDSYAPARARAGAPPPSGPPRIVPRVAAALVASLLLVIWLVPAAHWRATILWNKGTGEIENIGWRHLIKMMMPGSGIYLEPLASTPNPFLVIRNPLRSAADIEAGAKLFQERCASCHGAEARGGAGGPSLVDRAFKQGRSDWAFFRTITVGVKGTPMVGQDLSDRSVWRLVAYLNSVLVPAGESSVPPIGREFSALDTAVLCNLNAPRDEWLTYSGSYDGRRHSALTQINAQNVHALRIEWLRQIPDQADRLEGTPLVRGSVMFVTSAPNQIHALDVRTGEVLWTYSRELPSKLYACCRSVNRGVALAGDTVYLGTLDAHLVAVEATTGRVRWDVQVANHEEGYSITGAPLAIEDKIITGVAGGEYGIRGFLDAYDATTGERLWRHYTVPAPGEPGHETWEGDSWQTGGAPTWLTGTYDPKLRLIYWTTGNPAPNFYGNERSGDNLYSNSVIAVDPDTGKRRWHFQFTPHDEHDWDSTQIPMLIDAPWPGTSGRLLALANRNGFFYVLDRTTGKFLAGTAFVRQSWADGLDAQGRPNARRSAIPSRQGTLVYPGVTGGTNWWSPAYSPLTGLAYVPTIDRGSIYFRSSDDEYRVGSKYPGGDTQMVPNEKLVVAVKAIELTTGQIRWQHAHPARFRHGETGGLLSTAGGVVFGGDLESLFALNAHTGEELWRLRLGGQIVSAPVTYTAGGRQFITVLAGSDVVTLALP